MPMPFLTAEWRHLVMLNYEIDAELLVPGLPSGTELDTWNGKAIVSLVGFRFSNTRVLGIPIPFHQNFDEINLRFYVLRVSDGETRRGVVFVREIVAKPAVALVARWVYNENFLTFPTGSRVELPDPPDRTGGRVEYEWQTGTSRNSVYARIRGEPSPPADGSEEQFITEHYWGYVVQRDGSTKEYRVEHPPWRVWSATDAGLGGGVATFYGPRFRAALEARPRSAFVADGSAVSVYRGVRLTRELQAARS